MKKAVKSNTVFIQIKFDIHCIEGDSRLYHFMGYEEAVVAHFAYGFEMRRLTTHR